MEGVKHREELIRRIKNIKDKNVLNKIYRLFDIDLDDPIYWLNLTLTREIEQVREEIKKQGHSFQPSEQRNRWRAKEVIWSPLAKRKEILEFWIEHNKSNTYSIKLNNLFKEAKQLIAEHPNIGKPASNNNVV